MENIQYRQLEKSDYAAVRTLISDAFGLEHYIADKKVLKKVKKMYLCSCLSEHTFSRVALYQGEVVGIILGASKNDRLPLSNLSNALKRICYALSIGLFHKKECVGQGNIHNAYDELIADCKERFDGVLTLFIVKESVRGIGVGKELLSALQAYYREHHCETIYLYTDDTCNYGFYEHMGFRRMNERKIDIIRDSKKGKLDVYLYAWKIEGGG